MKYSFGLAAVAAFVLSTGGAVAAPVDLSPWLADGGGTWTLEADNNGVKQSVHSSTTVFHNNQNSQGTIFSATVEVQTTYDDDYFGFVLGYTQGDINGPNTDQDYLLIDWKQITQGGWGPGISISRVTGDIQASGTNTSTNAWQHTGPVEVLTRSNTGTSRFADVGWVDNQEYSFGIDFTASQVRIFIDGVLEFDILAADFGGTPFADGSFGFYNYSQPQVRFSNIEAGVDLGISENTNLSPVPLPAGLPILLGALGALGLVARRRKS